MPLLIEGEFGDLAGRNRRVTSLVPSIVAGFFLNEQCSFSGPSITANLTGDRQGSLEFLFTMPSYPMLILGHSTTMLDYGNAQREMQGVTLGGSGRYSFYSWSLWSILMTGLVMSLGLSELKYLDIESTINLKTMPISGYVGFLALPKLLSTFLL